MSVNNIVSLGDSNLSKYIIEINKFPVLTEEQESFHYKELANGNMDSAKLLVSSHLRMVVKIAGLYKNYGLPTMDLIMEGNIGLMRAVKTFDWTKGYKLATYARWWIQSYIQEYILKMWSIVKIGTSSVQKKLFFGLKKAKDLITNYTNRTLTDEDVNKISHLMNVEERDVIEMNKRIMKKDGYLNSKCGSDEDAVEIIDLLPSKQSPQDILVEKKMEKAKNVKMLNEALKILNERERKIIQLRQLQEEPLTLKEISAECGVSGERVRQIESKALLKMKNFLLLKGAVVCRS